MKGHTATMIALSGIVCIAAAGPLFGQASTPPLNADSPPIVVTGERLAGLERFDAGMLAFMRQYRVTGASLAIVKCGHLVYARGFGHADVANREPVLPTSLFRIASVSKTITAVAILHLIERGKLRPDERVFELLKLASKLRGGTTLDPRWKQITVSHLLRHVGGWDRERSGDPIDSGLDILRFNRAQPPLTTDHIIRYMLARPLDFDPGQRYAYSNFGFCLLGRVVESVTGETYEDYVRKGVLEPMGIMDMRIGKTLRKDRAGRGALLSPERADEGQVSIRARIRRGSSPAIRSLLPRSDGLTRRLDCLVGRPGSLHDGTRPRLELQGPVAPARAS